MKITKFGHCCLLIEEKDSRIVIDPGIFSTGQDEVKNIDLILITHEHADHCNIESIKNILKNNPTVKIIGNNSVGSLLQKENISHLILEDGQKYLEKDAVIEACGNEHAVIHPDLPKVQNTGFFINNKLFYPGDSFVNPSRPVEILALPVAGPWMKISEAIDYAQMIRPRVWFPMHDGILKYTEVGSRWPAFFMDKIGVKTLILEIEKEMEIIF